MSQTDIEKKTKKLNSKTRSYSMSIPGKLYFHKMTIKFIIIPLIGISKIVHHIPAYHWGQGGSGLLGQMNISTKNGAEGLHFFGQRK